MAYQYPPRFEANMTFKERVEMDEGYEPIRHENTGVNAEEQLYESYLIPVDEAIVKLGGRVSSDVVRKGWEAIQLRQKMEQKMEENMEGS